MPNPKPYAKLNQNLSVNMPLLLSPNPETGL